MLFNVEQPETERWPREENIKIILWLSIKDSKTPYTLSWARILSFKSTIYSYDCTVVQKWLTERENYGLQLKRIFRLIGRQIKASCVWMYPWSLVFQRQTKYKDCGFDLSLIVSQENVKSIIKTNQLTEEICKNTEKIFMVFLLPGAHNQWNMQCYCMLHANWLNRTKNKSLIFHQLWKMETAWWFDVDDDNDDDNDRITIMINDTCNNSNNDRGNNYVDDDNSRITKSY